MAKSKAGGLDWLLDDLVARTAGAEHAVVLSTDGLCIGRSRSLSQEDAEHLSAMAAAFQNLARGVGRHFDGGQVRQTLIELDRRFLAVTAAGHGACIAVLAAADADIGMIAYEMHLIVKKVGELLVAHPRARGGA